MNDEEAGKLSLGIALVITVIVVAILWIPELQGTPGLSSCMRGLTYDKTLATEQGFICGFLILVNILQAIVFNLG